VADRAVVDRVFNAIIEQTSEEVGALLGADVTLENHQTRLLNKEQVFEIKRGRSVLSTMEISGDQDGKAFLITDQKDSITLGGTLIMLPPDQIEENCKQRSFEGEAADAFGEVANIIAGVYTSIFLDMYPENLHFKRTDVDEFLPSRLDPASNLPFPPGEYFYSSCSIKLENESMGMLEAIIPAQILGLASEARSAEEVPPEHAQKTPDKDTVAESKGEGPQPEAPDENTAAAQEDATADEVIPGADEESAEPQEVEQPPAEEKHVELSVADRVLKASLEQCAEEIGAMLGLEVELSSLNTAYISKAEYFSKPGPKSTVTEMLVNGDQDGVSYFIVDLKDSIFFGGTLVMLPEDELSNRIRSGELDGEIEDAFGEVANIISGGIVQNFDEMFPRKFHVKKGNVEAFTPTKVMVEDPKPFPDGEYYSVSASMDCDTHDLGRLTYLIPVELLHIPPRPAQSGWGDTTAAEESPQAEQRTGKAVEQEEKEKSPETPAKTEKSAAQSGASATDAQEQVKEPVVAVVYKDSSMAEAYTEALKECGHTPVALAANQSFNSLRQNQVCGALLIIDRVDDDAFALMIKIRSETPAQQPLIVAGPDWTRSAVLKAVKYGVTDIIPTPATAAEIREKVEHNLKNSC
jgi:chemotaxis protein CheY-P-specific phosphatase CheC